MTDNEKLNELLEQELIIMGNPPAYSKYMAKKANEQFHNWFGSKSMTDMKPTVTRPPCKECNGTGEVVFTKEKGGPICNSCGGNGYLTDEIICRTIASAIDYPSVYMGGPSHNSIRKAERIIKILKEDGLL